MLAIAIFLLLLQTTTTRAQESRQAVFEIANNSFLFDETPLSEKRSDSLTSCSQQCTRDKRCQSANFIKSEEMCSLMDKTRRTHPLLFLKQVNTVYLHKVWEITRKLNILKPGRKSRGNFQSLLNYLHLQEVLNFISVILSFLSLADQFRPW